MLGLHLRIRETVILWVLLGIASLSATLRASDIPHNSASNISLFFPRAVLWIFHLLEKVSLYTTATPAPRHEYFCCLLVGTRVISIWAFTPFWCSLRVNLCYRINKRLVTEVSLGTTQNLYLRSMFVNFDNSVLVCENWCNTVNHFMVKFSFA